MIITNLILLCIGAVAGAIGMYLIARNSPEHFLKTKKYLDAFYAQAENVVRKAKK